MKRVLILILLIGFAVQVNAQFRKRTNTNRSQSSGLNYTNPTEYEIAGIDVTGLKVLDKNALISLSGLKVGDRIKVPGDDISGAIKKLYKHGLVADVAIVIDKIEGDQIYLNLELAERPRLTGFTFEGIGKNQENHIRQDLNLIRGRILSDAIIRNTQMTVKNYFIDKGYLNVDVKIVQQEDTLNTDGVKLKIFVEPKGKVKIHEIDIIGNEHFSDLKIKSKMKSTNEHLRFALFRRAAETVAGITGIYHFMTHSYEVSDDELKNFFTENVKLNFFKSQKFKKEEYEADKDAIIAFYNSKGYRDAKIVSDTIYAYGDDEINIAITIEEGSKYYFRNIIWTGNFVYSDEILDKVLNINKGDVYNKELIDQKLTFNPKGPDISGLYMDDGYLFFNVTPVEVAVEGDSIDVEMRIREGSQATIKNVAIAGNERTRDHVIRRELLTVPGRKFSRSDIITTQQRLAQLGYFDPEQISPNILPNPADETVDIEWQVVERSSDQIELSGGWGGAFGFVGTLGLSLNNFSVQNMLKGKFTPIPVGDGQKLSLRAQANGRQFQSYSFSFTEPWLGGKKPNSLSLSYNYSIQRQTVPEFDESGNPLRLRFDDYNARLSLQSITLGLGRRLSWPDNYFSLLNSISYTVYELENFGARGLGFSDGNANSFTFNTTISRNSVDNPMYPKSGSTISLNISLTPPYSLFKEDNFWQLTPAEIEEARSFVDTRFSSATQSFRDQQFEQELINRRNSERYKWIEYHKWMFDAKYYIPIA
ncbi:MAG: POTRA domain-containing protein, partial [Fulvivirga sp.]|nr:POTRA domain-containing protein [Fulvivirga sp.]